jgi:hypothetical protein
LRKNIEGCAAASTEDKYKLWDVILRSTWDHCHLVFEAPREQHESQECKI